MSDALPGPDYPIEELAADALAVLDAAEFEQAVLWGDASGGAVAIWLAVHCADRVTGLVLDNSSASVRAQPGYEVGFSDMKAFREVVAEAGFLKDSTRFSDDQLRDYFKHFWEFVLDDEPMTTTPEWSSESVRRFFDPTGEHGDVMRAANVPAAFVILQRINLGLGAVLGELRATCNWRRIAEEQWPFVDRAPSTPLGEREAAWRASQPDTSVR